MAESFASRIAVTSTIRRARQLGPAAADELVAAYCGWQGPLGRIAARRSGGHPDPGDQLRTSPEQGNPRARPRRDRGCRSNRVRHPTAPRTEPAVRPACRRASCLLGRGLRWDHRLGSLLGSAFVSQQYLQNVNGYSTLEAGAAFLPAVIFMILVAPRSAKLVETRGATFTLLTGYVSLFLAFAWMFMRCSEGSPLLAGGDGLHAHRNWRGSCRHTGLPLPHGSVPVQRAPGWPPALPPCIGSHREGPRHGRRLSRHATMDWTLAGLRGAMSL
jgi:hypothetical protein